MGTASPFSIQFTGTASPFSMPCNCLAYDEVTWITCFWLSKLTISRFYPHIQLRFVFTSKFTMSSLFKFKDRIPNHFLSSVVYEYNCGHCASSYIGQTGKQLKIKMSQHKGRSFRTGQLLESPEFSNIWNHAF